VLGFCSWKLGLTPTGCWYGTCGLGPVTGKRNGSNGLKKLGTTGDDSPFGINPRPEKDRPIKGEDWHYHDPFPGPPYIPPEVNPFAVPMTGPKPTTPYHYPFGFQPEPNI